jgi:flagellar biosynthesis/type III secretory pathway chaperone
MDTDQLAELIDAKLAVLVQLLGLSRHQVQVIDDSDLSALLRVLAGKQQLVGQLDQLDRQLAPFTGQSSSVRVWASGQARQRCREQAARCEAVLREILLAEQEAERRMTQRRDAASQQLAAVNQASQAQRAYVPAMPLPSGTLDLTSEG